MTKQMQTIDKQGKKQRLDKWLSGYLVETSRSQVQTWIEDGYVTVNGQKTKSNYKCQFGDLIEWEVPEVKPLSLTPESIPLDVPYEDEHLLVVNKPKGMVVHPSAGHESGTLVHALLAHCDDLSGINGVHRPGIVHRIDKDTSGLLVVAKHDRAHERLQVQMQEKEIIREYIAIVHGDIQHVKGTIEAPIGRDPNNRQKMSVVKTGKPAITHFEVVERFSDFTCVKCELETGRTHQIRVHFQYIDHPIVGDPKYGRRKTLNTGGQLLHAFRLQFLHPITKEKIKCESEAPQVFKSTLEELSLSNN